MKYFLNYEVVRNNALKLADKIYRKDKFIPDIIYYTFFQRFSFRLMTE